MNFYILFAIIAGVQAAGKLELTFKCSRDAVLELIVLQFENVPISRTSLVENVPVTAIVPFPFQSADEIGYIVELFDGKTGKALIATISTKLQLHNNTEPIVHTFTTNGIWLSVETKYTEEDSSSSSDALRKFVTIILIASISAFLLVLLAAIFKKLSAKKPSEIPEQTPEVCVCKKAEVSIVYREGFRYSHSPRWSSETPMGNDVTYATIVKSPTTSVQV